MKQRKTVMPAVIRPDENTVEFEGGDRVHADVMTAAFLYLEDPPGKTQVFQRWNGRELEPITVVSQGTFRKDKVLELCGYAQNTVVRWDWVTDLITAIVNKKEQDYGHTIPVMEDNGEYVECEHEFASRRLDAWKHEAREEDGRGTILTKIAFAGGFLVPLAEAYWKRLGENEKEHEDRFFSRAVARGHGKKTAGYALCTHDGGQLAVHYTRQRLRNAAGQMSSVIQCKSGLDASAHLLDEDARKELVQLGDTQKKLAQLAS